MCGFLRPQFWAASRILIVAVVVSAFSHAAAQDDATKADVSSAVGRQTSAPPYAPAAPVAGRLGLVGSRTMRELAHLWARDFARIHPKSDIQVDCRGSEAALPTLAGDDMLGLMSRTPTSEELAQAKHALGREVIPLAVANDVIVICVHPENPLESISLKDLKRLFAGESAATWGDLALEGEWADRKIVLHGRDADSGTRHYIRAFSGAKGAAEPDMASHTSHRSIVVAVAADRNALGYASRTAASQEVKIVGIRTADEAPPAFPDHQDVEAGRYPLVRSLHVLFAGDPASESLTTEFIRFVLSSRGQTDAIIDGFLPRTRTELNEQFDRLGWGAEK
jgi:phosphate transport system substrate-binding protein